MRYLWLLMLLAACHKPAPKGPVQLQQRLLDQRATVVRDPSVSDPLRGMIRRGIGVDQSPGAPDDTYMVSLQKQIDIGQLDVRRAALLRGETRLVIRDVVVPPDGLLLLSHGAAPVSRRRAASRPKPSLVIRAFDGEDEVLETSIRTTPRHPNVWNEARVDLSALAGKTVRLEMSLEGWFRGDDDHVFVGDLGLYQLVKHDKPMNLVFLWLDKVRADLIVPNGGDPAVMPTLSKLAAENVNFTETRSTSNRTLIVNLQSFLSSLTVGGLTRLPSVDRPALPRLLAEHGYYTLNMGIGVHATKIPELGHMQVDAGFDRTRTSLDQRKNYGDAELFRDLVEPWFEHERREPFFMNLHYQGAHEKFPPADPSHPDWNKFMELAHGDPFEARYFLKARYADDVLKKTLQLLEKQKLLDHTMLVIVGDHGGVMGPDHRYFQWQYQFMVRAKSPTDYFEGQVRVPMVFVAPGLKKQTRPEPVSLIDVAPTMLDLAGIEPPPLFEGRSLLPAMRGQPLAYRPSFFSCELDDVFGVYDRGLKYVTTVAPVERWAVGKDFVGGDHLYKVSVDDREEFLDDIAKFRKEGVPIADPVTFTEQLYDLRVDPHEQKNLAAERPADTAALRKLVMDHVFTGPKLQQNMDPNRGLLVFTSPSHAVFEGRIVSDGPLLAEHLTGGCAGGTLTQPEPEVVAFRCEVTGMSGSLTYFQREGASLRFEVQKNGVPLDPRDLFLGQNGMPGAESLSFGPKELPPPALRPPTVLPATDEGLFFARLLPAHDDARDIGGGLKATFEAWGYAN